MKKQILIFLLLISTFFFSCKSSQIEDTISLQINEEIPEISVENQNSDKTDSLTQSQQSEILPEIQTDTNISEKPAEILEEIPATNSQIKLLFAGDVMAHSENYQITTFDKIWRDVKDIIEPSDLAFANIESPIDTTKPESTYPNFNMPKRYIQAAIDAGFDVFSLSNNHTNDQGLHGIKETIKTTDILTKEYLQNGKEIYFSGTKLTEDSPFTYNIIYKNGWTILFLPITELLNKTNNSGYVNFVKPDEESRKKFIKYCVELRKNNPCDLFILSFHTSELEYTRRITEKQKRYYKELLNAGVDVLWANHAHIIKDREFVYNSTTGSQKLIMYANGNTISGQRRKPELSSSNPDSERDNTGDGLFYYVTFEKRSDSPDLPPKIIAANHIFVTTYINTANEFVLKKCDEDFVKYLYDVPRNNWAEYIKRRIRIDNESTKDLITWQ